MGFHKTSPTFFFIKRIDTTYVVAVWGNNLLSLVVRGVIQYLHSKRKKVIDRSSGHSDIYNSEYSF